jgi:hypothetical protein
MHNDLAWAVLGVDPAIHKNLEHLASQRGVSIGRCLELMIHAVSVNESREAKRRKQLRGIMAEMAESLMDATELLDDDDKGGTRTAGQREPQQGLLASVPAKSEQIDERTREEEKGPSKVTDLRAPSLRRSA